MQSYTLLNLNIEELHDSALLLSPKDLSEHIIESLGEIKNKVDSFNNHINSKESLELLKNLLKVIEEDVTLLSRCKDDEKQSNIKLTQIIDSLKLNIEKYKQINFKTNSSISFEKDNLYKNQRILLKDEISEKFNITLEKIKKVAKFKFIDMYISHGEGDHNGAKDPRSLPEMYSFLTTFRNHLNKAGIWAKISLNDGDFGWGGLYNFQNKGATANHYLILGTESYLKKHESKSDMVVCGDLVMINRKRNDFRPSKVIPIVISGSVQKSLPEYFHNYITEQDWNLNGTYFTNFRKLISSIFDFKKTTEIESLNKAWDDFFKSIPQSIALELDPDYRIEQLSHKSVENSVLVKTISHSIPAIDPPPTFDGKEQAKTDTKDVKSINTDDDLPPPYTPDQTTSEHQYPSAPTTMPVMTIASQPVFLYPVLINSVAAVPPILATVISENLPPSAAATSSATSPLVTSSMFKQTIAKLNLVDDCVTKLINSLKNAEQKLSEKDARKQILLDTLKVIQKPNDREEQLDTLFNAHNDLYGIESPLANALTKRNCIYKIIRHWFTENEYHIKSNYSFNFKLDNHLLTNKKLSK